MCNAPYVMKDHIFERLKEEGIRPPRLYGMGFPHNNYGGFCIKAGQGQFKLLLEKMPKRFAYHEAKEQEILTFLGRDDISILRDRRGGTSKPMTLRMLRERIEQGCPDVDPLDLGGCGCGID